VGFEGEPDTSGMAQLTVRPAFPSDVPTLVALNIAAYPELVADGVVFDSAQLAAHQSVFPEGQLVCLDGTRVVGAIATLIVPKAQALAPHDWIGMTGHGTFSTHTPRGEVLYLADVYADPSVRGLGVGKALYDAMFGLCRTKALHSVVAGGRLFGYHEVAKTTSPERYVAEVLAGTRKDHVLTSQLGAGFELRGFLPGYLDDWRSAGYATHLVWKNEAVAEHREVRGTRAELRVRS